MTELAFRQAIGRVVRNAGPDDHSRAYVVMPALRAFDEFARRIEEDMPAFGPSPTACVKEKRCALCGGGSSLNATDCAHCGAEFPARASPGFRACDCGVLNRVGEASCLNCGADLLGTLRCSGVVLVSRRYVTQYQQSCLNARGKKPWWWNSVTAGPGPRLRALRRFRQLCLDAAK